MATTRELAKWCAQLEFKDLPNEVVEQAKKATLDFVGVATYVGTSTPWGRIIGEFAASEGGCQPESIVLGIDTKTLAGKAALANGTMAMGFEYEDILWDGGGHPYTTALPPALALAEKERRSGQELLAAVVASVEVTTRVGNAIGLTEYRRMLNQTKGMYTPATNGVFGAAAAAAKVLRLDDYWLNHALGLAAMQACGLFQGQEEGTMARRFNAGKASESGVTAALLAQRGFTGLEQGLEGRFGYYNALWGGTQLIGKLTEGLGQSWAVMHTSFKAYPMNGTLHSPVECILKLRQEHNIRPQDVAEITAQWNMRSPVLAKKDIPSRVTAAQYSLPYVLAVALVRGKVTAEEFTEDAIHNPEVLELMQKVSVAHDPDLNKKAKSVSRFYSALGENLLTFPGRVSIKLKDGRQFTHEVLWQKGSLENPLSLDELRRKFINNTSHVFAPQQQDKIFQVIMGLDQIDDVNKLTELLVVPG